MTDTNTLIPTQPKQERINRTQVIGSMADTFELDEPAVKPEIKEGLPEYGTIHFNRPAAESIPGSTINIGGIVSEQVTQAASEVWSTVADTLGVTADALGDLGRQFIGTTEKTPVPSDFQKAFEGEDPTNLDPAVQKEQIEKKADVEEALAHNRRIIQSVEDLQKQKGEELIKTAQRLLETDPTSIIANSLRESSKERIKGAVKPPKLASDNPFEIAKQRASLHDYDIHYEAKQQVWIEEEVEEVESEKSLAKTQPVVNMNAIMEGGTGGAKANISQTGGGAG